MKLSRLIYYSRVAEGVTIKDAEHIAHAASEANEKRGITGELLFSTRYFLQVLEGGRVDLSNLFRKIAEDERHNSVVLVSMEDIDQRQFSSWGMSFVAINEDTRPLLSKFFVEQNFAPHLLSANASVQLALNLRAHVQNRAL